MRNNHAPHGSDHSGQINGCWLLEMGKVDLIPADGSVPSLFAVSDLYSRWIVCSSVVTRWVLDIIDALEQFASKHAFGGKFICDPIPEFRAPEFLAWTRQHGISVLFRDAKPN